MASRIALASTAFATSRRAREAETVRDPRHLAWIRTLPCAVSGEYPTEAAHISFADKRYGKPERAKGRKADDRFVLPLTARLHREGPDAQHKTGKERDWWERHGIDANALANDLWRVSGDTDAALLILAHARRRPALWPAGNSSGD